MSDLLYTVVPCKAGNGFRIHIGGAGMRRSMWSKKVFDTVPAAKLHMINAMGINPVRSYGTKEVAFDIKHPVHAALEKIEYRHNTHGEIMSVAPTYYTVRRTRFGIEEKITCSIELDCVRARNDTEQM